MAPKGQAVLTGAAVGALAVEGGHAVVAGGALKAGSTGTVVNVLAAVLARPAVDAHAVVAAVGVMASAAVLTGVGHELALVHVLRAVLACESPGGREARCLSLGSPPTERRAPSRKPPRSTPPCSGSPIRPSSVPKHNRALPGLCATPAHHLSREGLCATPAIISPGKGFCATPAHHLSREGPWEGPKVQLYRLGLKAGLNGLPREPADARSVPRRPVPRPTCPFGRAAAVVGVHTVHTGAPVLAAVCRAVIYILLAALAGEACGRGPGVSLGPERTLVREAHQDRAPPPTSSPGHLLRGCCLHRAPHFPGPMWRTSRAPKLASGQHDQGGSGAALGSWRQSCRARPAAQLKALASSIINQVRCVWPQPKLQPVTN